MLIQCDICQKSSSRTIAVRSPLRMLLGVLSDKRIEVALLCPKCYASYNEATRKWLEVQRPDLFAHG